MMNDPQLALDLESLCRCPELYWFDCYSAGYDKRFKQYVTRESFQHPAKMSWGLLSRIYDHLELLGLLKADSTVIDFMAGTGRTNVMAALRGYRTVAVELEPHFTKMIKDNKQVVEKLTMHPADWEIIEGDSRRLSQLLKTGGAGITSSPYISDPSVSHMVSKNRADPSDPNYRPSWARKINGGYLETKHPYSSNPANIGNLSDKVGITSSPYGNRLSDDDKREFMDAEGKFRRPATSYGSSDAQIGNLADRIGIVSSPYGRADDRVSKGKVTGGDVADCLTRTYEASLHGSTAGQIGNLSDKVGVTSPPYEETLQGNGKDYSQFIFGAGKRTRRNLGAKYSSSRDNIGNSPETFSQAMKQVYGEAFKSGISPLVTVTKNPTRDHKLRRLDLLTRELLESVGYRIIDYHRAILFKVRGNMTLDGGETEDYKGRLSFFKRLSLEGGNIAAKYEDIIFAAILRK